VKVGQRSEAIQPFQKLFYIRLEETLTNKAILWHCSLGMANCHVWLLRPTPYSTHSN